MHKIFTLKALQNDNPQSQNPNSSNSSSVKLNIREDSINKNYDVTSNSLKPENLKNLFYLGDFSKGQTSNKEFSDIMGLESDADRISLGVENTFGAMPVLIDSSLGKSLKKVASEVISKKHLQYFESRQPRQSQEMTNYEGKRDNFNINLVNKQGKAKGKKDKLLKNLVVSKKNPGSTSQSSESEIRMSPAWHENLNGLQFTEDQKPISNFRFNYPTQNKTKSITEQFVEPKKMNNISDRSLKNKVSDLSRGKFRKKQNLKPRIQLTNTSTYRFKPKNQLMNLPPSSKRLFKKHKTQYAERLSKPYNKPLENTTNIRTFERANSRTLRSSLTKNLNNDRYHKNFQKKNKINNNFASNGNQLWTAKNRQLRMKSPQLGSKNIKFISKFPQRKSNVLKRKSNNEIIKFAKTNDSRGFSHQNLGQMKNPNILRKASVKSKKQEVKSISRLKKKMKSANKNLKRSTKESLKPFSNKMIPLSKKPYRHLKSSLSPMMKNSVVVSNNLSRPIHSEYSLGKKRGKNKKKKKKLNPKDEYYNSVYSGSKNSLNTLNSTKAFSLRGSSLKNKNLFKGKQFPSSKIRSDKKYFNISKSFKMMRKDTNDQKKLLCAPKRLQIPKNLSVGFDFQSRNNFSKSRDKKNLHKKNLIRGTSLTNRLAMKRSLSRKKRSSDQIKSLRTHDKFFNANPLLRDKSRMSSGAGASSRYGSKEKSKQMSKASWTMSQISGQTMKSNGKFPDSFRTVGNVSSKYQKNLQMNSMKKRKLISHQGKLKNRFKDLKKFNKGKTQNLWNKNEKSKFKYEFLDEPIKRNNGKKIANNKIKQPGKKLGTFNKLHSLGNRK